MKILIMFLTVFCFLQIALAQEVLQQPVAAPVVVSAPVDSDVNPIEAPPQWLVEALKMVYSLPGIGPILSKGMQWAGVLAVILTSLVAFLLGVVALLQPLVTWAGFTKLAELLQKFKDSKFMYYLKYLSMFNAQKKV